MCYKAKENVNPLTNEGWTDIIEIDSIDELIAVDDSYKKYK